MAISQSVLDNAAGAMITAMLPKAPLEVAIGQSVALQAKTAGIGLADEQSKVLISTTMIARQALEGLANDDPLKVAAENMLAKLMEATGELGTQAAAMKLPK